MATTLRRRRGRRSLICSRAISGRRLLIAVTLTGTAISGRHSGGQERQSGLQRLQRRARRLGRIELGRRLVGRCYALTGSLFGRRDARWWWRWRTRRRLARWRCALFFYRRFACTAFHCRRSITTIIIFHLCLFSFLTRLDLFIYYRCFLLK